jgi:hypothetical protein
MRKTVAKSCYGLGASEVPREVLSALMQFRDDILYVSDTHQDDRFADNPFVTGAPGVRFYAGFPLEGEHQHKVGTLCIIDTKPRTLGERELKLLSDLGAWAYLELTTITVIQRELSHRSQQLRDSEMTFLLMEGLPVSSCSTQGRFIMPMGPRNSCWVWNYCESAPGQLAETSGCLWRHRHPIRWIGAGRSCAVGTEHGDGGP